MSSYDHTSTIAEWFILTTLLGWHPAPAHVDELAEELRKHVEDEDGIPVPEITVRDALGLFESRGLVHRAGDFAWASYTALAAEEVITADRGNARAIA